MGGSDAVDTLFLVHCLLVSLASGAGNTLALVLTGLLSWQLIEYCIHRFAFHSIPGVPGETQLLEIYGALSARTAFILTKLAKLGTSSCTCVRHIYLILHIYTHCEHLQNCYISVTNAMKGVNSELLQMDIGVSQRIFLFHGCHHKYPLDATRLVFPPLPAAAVAAGIVAVLRLFLSPVSTFPNTSHAKDKTSSHEWGASIENDALESPCQPSDHIFFVIALLSLLAKTQQQKLELLCDFCLLNFPAFLAGKRSAHFYWHCHWVSTV